MRDHFNRRQIQQSFLLLSVILLSISDHSPALAQAGTQPDCQATALGLVADGVTDNTAALQNAIDDCSAAGRRLVLGGGSYLTGSITLRSNLHLHIEKGATLQGSADPMAYDGGRIQKDNEGNEQPLKPLISGDKLLNVKITGGGKIDGNGQAFWDARTYDRNYKGKIKPRPMPWFVIEGCRDFTLDGPTLTNAPSFTFTLENCDGALLTNFRIENPFDSPNTDGVQINDSVDVKV
ncbi:MAG: glycoside hydrolase family 28 protein, partial [Beijerinckiaceae bacterium]